MKWKYNYWRTMELGAEYLVYFDSHRPENPRFCRFIQVTRKGFNLLDLQTSKCILKKHLYVKNMQGREIPPQWTRFKVGIPNFLQATKLEKKATA
jgi:hypothetical protein